MTEPTRTKDETGREILVYDNGARKDAKTGQFINGPTDPNFNPVLADPRGMLARRNALSRQVADEAIDEGAGVDPSKWGTGEGWRKVIVHTVQTYLKSSNIRGMAEVLGKLGVAAGYLSERGGEIVTPREGISATPQALMELIEALQKHRDQLLEKAGAVDGEEAC